MDRQEGRQTQFDHQGHANACLPGGLDQEEGDWGMGQDGRSGPEQVWTEVLFFAWLLLSTAFLHPLSKYFD